MSQFYRCDAEECGAEAPDPGFSWSDETVPVPPGWKCGPKGDFCPKHPMRLANGQNVWLPHSPGWKNTGTEMASVVGFNRSTQRYTLEWLPEGDEEYSRVTRKAETVHTASDSAGSVSWVPIG